MKPDALACLTAKRDRGFTFTQERGGVGGGGEGREREGDERGRE